MCTGRAKIWAWIASISLHIIALAVFAASELSPAVTAYKQQQTPSVKVEQIKQAVQAQPKISKPKIKYIQSPNISHIEPLEQGPKLTASPETVTPDYPDRLELPDNFKTADATDFFSTNTNAKRICFVVDCSGSMKGLFGTVKKELTQVIQNLQQDQYFSIIFFGDDKLLMFENARLVRASNNAKAEAVSFIYSVEPKGKTNAAEAFKKLPIIRDSDSRHPSAVFFLTDGFELDRTDSNVFLKRVMNLLAINLPETIVNTFGFWPDENDCALLSQIAEQTGGSFTRIGEKEN